MIKLKITPQQTKEQITNRLNDLGYKPNLLFTGDPRNTIIFVCGGTYSDWSVDKFDYVEFTELGELK